MSVKLREHYSPLSIHSAATRWSEGLVQTLMSPINQQISFLGRKIFLNARCVETSVVHLELL